jgi:hypothetical protein
MGSMAFIAFLLFVLGLINIFAPYVGWYMTEGWKFKDAEPSDAALLLYRIGGVIGVIVSIYIFIKIW